MIRICVKLRFKHFVISKNLEMGVVEVMMVMTIKMMIKKGDYKEDDDNKMMIKIMTTTAAAATTTTTIT